MTSRIKVNEIEIEYSIDGVGEPLLLIGGLGYCRWAWHRMIPELAKKFQVISFDNRGVGGTTRTPGPYSAELLAKDTACLMDALGIKKATILGISMGGFIAQALAISRPDLFKRLILMSTGFGGAHQVPTTKEVLDQLKNPTLDLRARALLSCAPDFAEKEKDFVDYWVEYRTKNPIHPDGYMAQLAIGLQLLQEGKSFEKDLPKINFPTLIVFGELDRLIPAANGNLLKKVIPGSKLILLPKVSHFLPFECPQRLNQEIIDFVSRT